MIGHDLRGDISYSRCFPPREHAQSRDRSLSISLSFFGRLSFRRVVTFTGAPCLGQSSLSLFPSLALFPHNTLVILTHLWTSTLSPFPKHGVISIVIMAHCLQQNRYEP